MSSQAPDLERLLPGLRANEQDLLSSFAARRDSGALLADFPERGARLTFADAFERAVEDAKMLLRRGAGPGVPVVLALHNEPEFIPLWLATLMTRSIAVVLDPNLPALALAEIVERTGPAVVVTAEGVQERKGRAPLLAPGAAQDRVDPRDLATVVFTGGTTGRPKGIMLSRRYLHTFTDQWVRSIGMTGGDVHLLDLPYCHANGLILGLGGSLHLGRPCVVYQRFSASRYWDRILSSGATTASWIGGMGGILTKQPAPQTSTLELVLCVPRPPDPAGVEERFGVRLIETWGSTEAGIACWIDPQQREPGFGPTHPPYTVWIRGEDGQPVAPGEPGEMIVECPDPLWMCSGYWRDAEPDVAWDGIGRLETGDMIRQLDDGGHTFVGRTTGDIIRHRGHNVATASIEHALLQHPDIHEAAAVGIPSEVGESDILIAYTVGAGADPSAPSLRDFLVQRVAPFEVPRYFSRCESLPETVKHTVRKSELVGLHASAWDATASRAQEPAG